jgi:hypothetical protein
MPRVVRILGQTDVNLPDEMCYQAAKRLAGIAVTLEDGPCGLDEILGDALGIKIMCADHRREVLLTRIAGLLRRRAWHIGT